MGDEKRWFQLPDLYRLINSQELLKQYAIAYMLHNHKGWKPTTIENNRVLAVYRGEENV